MNSGDPEDFLKFPRAMGLVKCLQFDSRVARGLPSLWVTSQLQPLSHQGMRNHAESS